MRPLEFVLVTTNLLALFLGFRSTAPKLRWAVTGLNWLGLLAHGSAEGLRYQMAFSYAYVALLTIFAFSGLNQLFSKIRAPRVLRIAASVLSLLGIVCTSILAVSLPVFSFTEPTGRYAVGIAYFHMIDEERTEPFLHNLKKKRALMVKMYYPAKSDQTKPFDPYFHGSLQLMRALATFYQMPSFFFDHFALVETRAKVGLAVSSGQRNYPVVLFSHGAGTTVEVSTSQGEDLASHGYIVAAIDHPYVSAATVFPQQIIMSREATTNFDTPEPAEPITQIMAQDAQFVITALSKINQTDPVFKQKLDLDNIGVMGHSVGGAVAYNLAINDPRVKAAINLDGSVYVKPKTNQAIAPFLMLANDQYHVQNIKAREPLIQKFDSTPEGVQSMLEVYGSKRSYEITYKKAHENIEGLAGVLQSSGDIYTITGSDHMKLTDIGLFFGSQWLRQLLQIRGQTAPSRCLEITEALTVAFFDRHLNHQSAAKLTVLFKTYPELKRVSLN